MSLDFEWWHICIIAFLIFLAFLFTNYILKKINEARIEERLARLQKTPTNQSTQIHETVVNIKPLTKNPENAVSLVFDKDDNILQDHRKSRDIYPIRSKTRELEDIKEIIEKPDDILSNTRQMTDKGFTSVTETVDAQSSENNKTLLASLVIKDTDYDNYASNSISLMSQKTAETQSFKISERTKPIALDTTSFGNRAVQISTTTRITNISNKVSQDKLDTNRMDSIHAGTLVSGIQQKIDDDSSSKISDFKTNKQEEKETDATNLDIQGLSVMPKIEERLTVNLYDFEENAQKRKENDATNLNIQLPDIMKKTEKVISFKLQNSETNSQESKETVTFKPEIPASVILKKTKTETIKISDAGLQIPDVLEKIEHGLPVKINNFEKNRQDIQEGGATYLNNQVPMQETKEMLSFKINDFEKNRLEVEETAATNLNFQRPDILEKTDNGLPSKIIICENNKHEIKAPDVTNVNIQGSGVVQKTEEGEPFKMSNLDNNSKEIKETVALNPESSTSIILGIINGSKIQISETSEPASHKSTLLKSSVSSVKENTGNVNHYVDLPEVSQIKTENSSQKIINTPKLNDTETVNLPPP